MAFGPGKYDEACTGVRYLTAAQGVILIVFKGEHGNGFSAQLPPEMTHEIPSILRQVADDIEATAPKRSR